MGCLHQIPPLRSQGARNKRRQNVSKGGGRTRKQGPLKQCEQHSYELTDAEAARTGPAQVLCVYMIASSLVFRDSWMQTSGSLILAPSFGLFSFYLFICFIQFQCVSFCFGIPYHIILLFHRNMFIFCWETESGWIWMGGQVGRIWEE